MRLRFQGIEIGQTSRHVNGIGIENFDPGYPEVRDSDEDHDGRDGVMPGRDFLGRTTLGFDVFTHRRTMVEARDTLAEFLAAWRSRSVRLAAGETVPLEYQAIDDPRWRRVYGRPRRSDNPGFDVLMRQGNAKISLEFVVMEPRVFGGGEEGEQSARIGQIEGYYGGGWRFPLRFPIRGAATAGSRVGALAVGGDENTVAVIEFHGPGSRLALDGNRGWHVGLREDVTLAYDEVITIDPLHGTVTDNFGRTRYAALDRRTPLDGVQLQPGVENVFFSALDPTHSAHAVVRWRDAYSSL